MVYLKDVHKRLHAETLYVIAKSLNQHNIHLQGLGMLNYYTFIQKFYSVVIFVSVEMNRSPQYVTEFKNSSENIFK